MPPSKKPYSRVKYDWSPENIALLGTISDAAVAERMGGKASTVMFKRQELGIKAYKAPVSHIKGKKRPNFNWTEEALSLIGTMTDAEVAKRLGLSNGAVSLKRRSLGIPGRSVKHPAIDIPDNLRPYLGVWSDAAIARKIGVSAGVVSRQRRQNQIKATTDPNFFPDEGIPRLGKVSDSDLAREYKVAPQTVNNQRRKRGIPKFKPEPAKLPDSCKDLLGKVSDVELGKRANLSARAISIMRKEAGIPPYDRGAGRLDLTNLPDFAVLLLGKLPDPEIAKKVGCNRKKVANIRVAAGIAPCARWR